MRRLGAAVAAVLALVLTGCVSVPTSGPVLEGQVIDPDLQQDITFLPAPPQRDAEPEAILRGFIDAATGTEDNYAVARQYLTPAFAEDWQPQQSVLIREGAETFAEVGTSASGTALVDYTATVAASVDATGHFTELPASQSVSLSFAFEQGADGQWRIAGGPSGIVLSSADFDVLFSQHALYFFDPTTTFLVPDVRWFAGRAQTSTRIVSALLSGPSEWLRGAVRSAFPEGTALSELNAVTVDDEGVAIVDLSGEALSASDSQLRLMRQQAERSLRTVPAVSSVRFTVDQTPLVVPEGGSEATIDPVVDDRALVLREGEFGWYASGRVGGIGSLSGKLVELGATAATLNSQLNGAAVLAPQGVFGVTTGDAAPALLDDRAGLIAPTIDQQDWVWSVPAGSPTAIQARVVAGGGDPVAIPTGALPEATEVVSIDVSRDGTRLMLLLASDTGPRLVVAGILRDGAAPSGLTEAVLDVPLAEGEALDATWVDDETVATLSETSAGTVVVQHTLGGGSESLGPVDGAVQIVGGNSTETAPGIRALAASGTAYVRAASGWSATIRDVSFLGTQQ
jgi:hypothetical protein